MIKYLKAQRNPYYRFLYFFFTDDKTEAEKALQKIKPNKLKNQASVMFHFEQKNFEDVKPLLQHLKDDSFKMVL
ncbi:hypothetical protein D1970_10010 [Mesobacillus zeae]|uniref:Uncharacterized protein n=1 Tax=Mesobacillus zeae TaxID=1917180 RepID=A0A398BDM3_9BACI|nr:hypothetical protein D1970_10010 [Mesobacillus zeae]